MNNLFDSILREQLEPLGRLRKITGELIQSIKICKEQRLFGPALISLYAGIDILASLNRLAGKDYVTRSDFIQWVEDYVLPNSNLLCTAIDLYAARCGVLHSLRYESTLADEGKARKIRYIFDNVDVVRHIMDNLEKQDSSIVVVDFTELNQSFELGVENFISQLENNPQNNKIILGRINTELIFFPLVFTI